MKKVILTALCLLLVIMLTACYLIKPQKNITIEPDGKDTFKVTVQKDDEFVLQFDENATTGYEWTYVIEDESMVKLIDDEKIISEEDEEKTGMGGQRVFAFKALEQGETKLKFDYERSWEEDSSVQTYIYNVIIE